jgi:hypothetical protein
MSMLGNNFVICNGYTSPFIERKKLIFYHIPKSAGTTICNILSTLLDDSFRLLGPLTSNSGFGTHRPQITSEEYFIKERNNIENKNFIYGHFSINLYNFFLNSLSITLIRNPIDRSFSHYNFQAQRGIIDTNTNLKDCFDEGFIPDNIITRQFSGNLNSKLDIEDYHLALKNLENKINIIFDFDNSKSLINYIISIYDLPNVIFQNQQITKNKYLKKNQENINIIKIFNKYDFELFKEIKEKGLFFIPPEDKKVRIKNKTLFWSQNDPVYGNTKTLINKKVEEIINYMKKND